MLQCLALRVLGCTLGFGALGAHCFGRCRAIQKLYYWCTLLRITTQDPLIDVLYMSPYMAGSANLCKLIKPHHTISPELGLRAVLLYDCAAEVLGK